MNFLPLVSFLAIRRASCLNLSAHVTFVLGIGLLCCSPASQSQSARKALITQPVNGAERITLSGNVHPLATRAADRGPVSEDSPANRMLLLLKRSPEQEVQLHTYLESLQDANSPNFHKWLTPAQFGAQWGPADSDVAAVTTWLQKV